MTCIPSNDSGALVKQIVETVDDAVMRVGASANCYNEPADANSGAEYVAARVRGVIVAAYTRQAQRGLAALSSRDVEIREVLEGLAHYVYVKGSPHSEQCWCAFVDDRHTRACLAAQTFYAKLQPLQSENPDPNLQK